MALFALTVIAATGLLAYGLMRFYPEGTMKWFRRIMLSRKLIFGILALASAWIFIASGYGPLIFLGALVVLGFWLYFFTEDPHEEVARWIG